MDAGGSRGGFSVAETCQGWGVEGGRAGCETGFSLEGEIVLGKALANRRRGPATKGGPGFVDNFGLRKGQLVIDLSCGKPPSQDRFALIWSELIRISSHVDHPILSLGGM